MKIRYFVIYMLCVGYVLTIQNTCHLSMHVLFLYIRNVMGVLMAIILELFLQSV